MKCLLVLVLFLLSINVGYSLRSFALPSIRTRTHTNGLISPLAAAESPEIEGEITSKEIVRLTLRRQEIDTNIKEILENITAEEAELARLDAEYGSEIARVKKEFNRIKERAVEESREATRMAKVDAVKADLPITDNYMRAKQIYQPLTSEGDKNVMGVYEGIFNNLNALLEEFGVVRVNSVGQPFDFNTMEAIMVSPSTEYAKDIVSVEYQVGYKMGDKCIRPAMVVVSAGPGP